MKLPGQLQWRKLAPREQIIIFLAAFVILGAAGVYLHDKLRAKLLALDSQLSDLKNETQGLKAELLLRQKEVDRAGAKQVAAKVRASLAAQTQAQLSQGGRLSSLIDELMRLAKEDDIQVISIKPGQPQDQGGYMELSITMDVQARFRNLGEYLHQMQHLQQVVLVGHVRAELLTVEQATLRVQVETVSFMGKV